MQKTNQGILWRIVVIGCVNVSVFRYQLTAVVLKKDHKMFVVIITNNSWVIA